VTGAEHDQPHLGEGTHGHGSSQAKGGVYV